MFLKRFVVGPVVERVFRPEVEGLEHLPAGGGVILASNHLSFSDSVFLPVSVPRQVFFLAKSDYFTGRGLRGRATAAFFRGIQQIPMDRSGGSGSQASLSAAAEALRQGRVLGIYPEGTRSPDGRLYRPKLGVARLALESGVPVIPVAMVNTDGVQPIGARLPRRRAQDGRRIEPVRTVLGPPVDLSAYRDRGLGRAVQRAAADDIAAAIRELSGQEYVDVYASSVKSLMEKQRVADAKLAVAQLLERARERTQATVENARERTQATVENARERTQATVENARERTQATVENAKERVRELRHPGREDGGTGPERGR
ncbi:1-acyl-sn-glycerol-3-phosphate acyltransferase [Rothia santali]|nr:1-acyl-sn-glycerol-3-phosphate acyltransferase [Rothia santali]